MTLFDTLACAPSLSWPAVDKHCYVDALGWPALIQVGISDFQRDGLQRIAHGVPQQRTDLCSSNMDLVADENS